MTRDRGNGGVVQGRGDAVTVPYHQQLDLAQQQSDIVHFDEDLIENPGARYTLAVIQVG